MGCSLPGWLLLIADSLFLIGDDRVAFPERTLNDPHEDVRWTRANLSGQALDPSPVPPPMGVKWRKLSFFPCYIRPEAIRGWPKVKKLQLPSIVTVYQVTLLLEIIILVRFSEIFLIPDQAPSHGCFTFSSSCGQYSSLFTSREHLALCIWSLVLLMTLELNFMH
ncbi:hypothetical protein RRG08_043380 [Elysia crispata]|uniref:Uncharacterized protein n=1 Tax=Elysia crispata TaxID=231223 RepID=A0AAE1ATK6_9GAST|nr:hypothetical protein RRG08_043380 [Elysia crispata]